jgi:ABC-type antimicrobial peptide transport system permease subunit
MTALLWIIGIFLGLYLALGVAVAAFLFMSTFFRDRETGRLHDGPIVMPLVWIVVTWPYWLLYAIGRMG